MTIKRMLAILNIHGIIPQLDGGKVIAPDYWYKPATGESGVDLVDITNWSERKLYYWLGY